MEFIEQDFSRALVLLSKQELAILNNALNEVIKHIDPGQFETHIGGSLGTVQRLLEEMAETYRAVPDP